MQKFITQQMYNFIGNEGYDQNADTLLSIIVEKYKNLLSEEEQEELLGQFMEVDKNGFETGFNCVCSFLSGKNMI